MFGMRLACNYNKYTGRESNLDPIEGSMQHVLGNLYIQQLLKLQENVSLSSQFT